MIIHLYSRRRHWRSGLWVLNREWRALTRISSGQLEKWNWLHICIIGVATGVGHITVTYIGWKFQFRAIRYSWSLLYVNTVASARLTVYHDSQAIDHETARFARNSSISNKSRLTRVASKCIAMGLHLHYLHSKKWSSCKVSDVQKSDLFCRIFSIWQECPLHVCQYALAVLGLHSGSSALLFSANYSQMFASVSIKSLNVDDIDQGAHELSGSTFYFHLQNTHNSATYQDEILDHLVLFWFYVPGALSPEKEASRAWS